jgi:hypothetical protein
MRSIEAYALIVSCCARVAVEVVRDLYNDHAGRGSSSFKAHIMVTPALPGHAAAVIVLHQIATRSTVHHSIHHRVGQSRSVTRSANYLLIMN